MTLQQLRYCIVVAEKGSISEAAKTLFVTQPSVTSAIHELEIEFKITIFNRTNRGMILSQEGVEFLSYARRELACQKITVFTEEGKRCELAKGATVVDFAFYEGKGTRMYTAIVNGESVPLNYTLKQGDTISIISLNEERVLDEEYCQNAQTIYAMQTIQRELKRKNS